MKMLVLVTDSEYEPHCLAMMREKGVSGYTVVPNAFGSGKSGVKMGDRYHPGASVVFLSAVPDGVVPELMACVRRCVADGKLCESTHAWVLPIDDTL